MYHLVASEGLCSAKSSEILTVLGGKASCRRKFVFHVHLLDEHRSLVSKDMSIIASVAYAHDHRPVLQEENVFLAEPPLFTTFNGVEFPASDRPTRMVSGKASFKLAISLLSSKCDNRHFCICFTPDAPPDSAPLFQPCFSKPICSISRKRTPSLPAVLSLRGNPANHSNTNKLAGTELEENLSWPASSSDHEGGATPVRDCSPRLQRSSRSSSVTSLQDFPSVARDGGSLLLRDPFCTHRSTKGTLATFLLPAKRVGDTNGGVLNENSAWQQANVRRIPVDKNAFALHLSPPESSSPSSGTMTPNHFTDQNNNNSSPQPSPLSQGRPQLLTFSLPSVTTPFRPYASSGTCKVPVDDFHSDGLANPFSSHCKSERSSHALLERVLNMRRALNLATGSKKKLESVLQGFNSANACHDGGVNKAWAGSSLEEEERSLLRLEVGLKEICRELETRNEEVRIKRRRLLEDEARIHSIVFQSSSWIQSLSGGFSF